MIKKLAKRFAGLAALLICVGLAGVAEATTYTQVFSQDFEDESTYTDNFYSGDVTNAIFGTKTGAHTGTPSGVTTNAERTIYGTTTTSHFYVNNRSEKCQSNVATYQFDSTVKALTSYQLEFDYYNTPGYSSYAVNYGLSINGTNSVIATFNYAGQGGTKSASTDGKIYNSDDATQVLATFTTGKRDWYADSDNGKPYWMHITVIANNNGVWMSVKRADKTETLPLTKISDAFIDLDTLYFRVSDNRNDEYGKRFDVDNIVVYSVTPTTYTWTGDAGDNSWSTAANWSTTVSGATSLPETNDVVVIGENASITTAVGQVVGTLTMGSGSKLVFDMTSSAKNETVTLFSVNSGTCPLTADNVELSGYDSTKYVSRFDMSDSKKIAVGLYDTTTFVWTDKGDNNYFGTVKNWAYGAEDGPESTTYPSSDCTLIFPASFTKGVTVGFDKVYYSVDSSGNVGFVSAITLGCDVTFASTSTTDYAVGITSISGSGTLSLSHIDLRTPTMKDATIASPLCIVDAALMFLRGGGADITITGALTGSGTLTLRGDTNKGKYFYITGATSGFKGTLVTQKSTRTDSGVVSECVTTYLRGDALDLSQATLTVGGQTYLDSLKADGTLKVGSLSGAGKLGNSTSYTVTLEVGGGTLPVLSGTWNVTKKSDADLSLAAGYEFPGTVTVSGGKLQVVCTSGMVDGNSHTLFTCKNTSLESLSSIVGYDMSAIENGDCYVPTLASSYDETTTTLTVSASFAVAKYTWTGDAGDNLWSNANNWQVEDAVAKVAPAAINEVSIGSAAIYVTPTQTFGTVKADSAAKLYVLFTAADQTFTKPTDFAGTVEAAGPFTMDDTGKSTRVASSFVWVGEDGNWSDLSNWQVNSKSTAVLPIGDDEVRFPAALDDVTVTMDAEGKATNVWTETALTLTGENALDSNLFNGPGSLILSNALITARLTADIVISNNIEVVTNTENKITLAAKYDCDTYGNITGSGLFQWDCRTTNDSDWNGMYFHGTNTAFAGTFKQLNGYSGRSGMGADEWTATSSNAVWVADSRSKDNTQQPFFPKGASGTYYFGAITGAIQGGDAEPNFEIGNRDDYDSNFIFLGRTTGASGGNKTRACCVTKVGSSHLTLRCGGVNGNGTPSLMLKGLTLKGGMTWTQYVPTSYLTFAGDGATLQINTNGMDAAASLLLDPSGVIQESTSAICFDDQGTNATWSTALKSSNTAGLTKKGAGTLTLTSTTDNTLGFSGYTRVEAGSLVITSGTHFKWDITSPVALSTAISGATPTSFGIGTVDTVWTYGTDSFTDTGHTVELDNLTAVDVSAYAETVTKDTKIVLMTAKQYRINGVAINYLPDVTINWGSVELPAGVTWNVKVDGNNLVVAAIPTPSEEKGIIEATVDSATAVTNTVNDIIGAGKNPTGTYVVGTETHTCVAVVTETTQTTVGVMKTTTVNDFLDLGQLAVGDTLSWYDSETGKYMAWQVTADETTGDKSWAKVAVVSGDNEKEEADDPATKTIEAGDATILKKAKTSKAVQLFEGTISSDTTVAAPTGATLKCLPSLTDKKVSEITATASVELYNSSGEQFAYSKTKGAWYKPVVKGSETTYKALTTEDTDHIPAGTGIFLRNNGKDAVEVK